MAVLNANITVQTVIAPTISGVPTISGTEQVGFTLTATAAPSTGTDPITTTWQWERNGTPIAGATSASYTLVGADEGTTLTVVQTDTNTQGSDTAESAATGVIAAASATSITSLTVSDQNAAGEVDVEYAISADSLVYLALTTSATPLSAADVQSGAGAVSNSSDNWTTSGGTDTLPAIDDGLASGTYYLQAVPAGGGDGDVVVSNGFTLETVLPTITNAETNAGGNNIILTLSEPVTGTSDPADWTPSGAPNVTDVTIIEQSTTITLTLDAAYGSGDSITLAYAGGDIVDGFNNALADDPSIAVTNQVPAGYSDNLVTVPLDRYMTVPAVPANQRSFFLFWSGRTSTTNRAILLNWDLAFFRTWLHDGGIGVHQAMNGGVTISGTHVGSPSLSGVRYHVLIEGHVDDAGDTISFVAYLRREDDANGFVQVLSVSDTTTAAFLSYISTQTGIMFGRETDQSEGFTGDQARLAVWVADDTAAGLQIADPSSTAVHDAFVDDATGLTVDPATSQALLAGTGVTRVIDLYGDAARYQLGTNDGTLTITPNAPGTDFTNVA